MNPEAAPKQDQGLEAITNWNALKKGDSLIMMRHLPSGTHSAFVKYEGRAEEYSAEENVQRFVDNEGIPFAVDGNTLGHLMDLFLLLPAAEDLQEPSDPQEGARPASPIPSLAPVRSFFHALPSASDMWEQTRKHRDQRVAEEAAYITRQIKAKRDRGLDTYRHPLTYGDDDLPVTGDPRIPQELRALGYQVITAEDLYSDDEMQDWFDTNYSFEVRWGQEREAGPQDVVGDPTPDPVYDSFDEVLPY